MFQNTLVSIQSSSVYLYSYFLLRMIYADESSRQQEKKEHNLVIAHLGVCAKRDRIGNSIRKGCEQQMGTTVTALEQ